jgi:hypothetical protein
MNSLVYLVAVSLKNSFLEMLRKPAKLVLYLFLIAVIVGMIVLSRGNADSFIDILWLKGILFLLILFFTVLAVQKGLASGDAIFDMSDVNLLFVSPVSSRAILIYGLVRMIKMAFLFGLFIPFQSHNIGTGFGVDFGAILLILAGFILAVVLVLILSLVIYSGTNGKPARKQRVLVLAAAVFLVPAVYAAVQFAQTGGIWEALERTLASPVFAWIPVAGWASEGVIALIRGDIGSGLLFLALLPLASALLVVYIVFSNPDYYEDVLVAAETSFEKKRALMEGRINTGASSAKTVKVRQTGLKGSGAAAVFYKHLRESFRENFLGLWGLPSILMIAGGAFFALILRNVDSGFITMMQTVMWVQILLIGTGHGLKEIYSHYIYLIPESSFSKILWSNLELVFKILVESVVMFGVSGAITGESPLLIAAAVLVYTLFSLLLIGINYLFLRWTGVNLNSGLLFLIYYLAVMLIMAPGVVGALVAGILLGGSPGEFAGLGILAAWELLAALVCFALSRGILHRCDMPVVKAKT